LLIHRRSIAKKARSGQPAFFLILRRDPTNIARSNFSGGHAVTTAAPGP
jgi:hypothetical protein